MPVREYKIGGGTEPGQQLGITRGTLDLNLLVVRVRLGCKLVYIVRDTPLEVFSR